MYEITAYKEVKSAKKIIRLIIGKYFEDWIQLQK